jgi:hypothetical protein
MSMKSIEWHDIESDFSLIEMLVGPNVSEDDIDAYKVARRHPNLLGSSLNDKLASGFLAVRLEETESEPLKHAIGILSSQPTTEDVPKHLEHYFPDHMAVVRNAVKARALVHTPLSPHSTHKTRPSP